MVGGGASGVSDAAGDWRERARLWAGFCERGVEMHGIGDRVFGGIQ